MLALVRLVYLFMAHIIIFIHNFLPRSSTQSTVVVLLERNILLGLPTCATHIAMAMGSYSNNAYILKYLIEFHNKYWMRLSLQGWQKPGFY